MALPPYHPQLAQLVKSAPDGDGWLHEIKHDGYRIGCAVDRGRVLLVSRNGNDWTAQFPQIRDAASRLPVKEALLDGEVAAVLPDGRTSFQALQNAFGGRGRPTDLVYFVFDLLALDGESLAPLPLETRKTRLQQLLERAPAEHRLRLSEHVTGSGRDVFRQACELGLEGIISKRRDAPYRPGRSDLWVKTKCVRRQEFVIGGFTDPEGSRVGIGALLVGHYAADGRLEFAGKVGTGFTHESAVQLRGRLEAIAQPESPFTPRPPGALGRIAHWVRPVLVAEVEFTEWTGDGRIRHPSFQGLRDDKKATQVRREDPAPARSRDVSPATVSPRARRSPTTGKRRRASADAPEVAGTRISHPDRPVYPTLDLTKLDVARYYERIATWMLPHLQGRPLTLVRCPEGITEGCFYMKHSKAWAHGPVRRVPIQEKTKVGDYFIVDDLAALVALVQANVLEFHTWNSVYEQLETPNRIVLDIDPGDDVSWTQVVEAARLFQRVLESLELQSFVKTTGGRGLHVVVPVAPRRDWSEGLAFARAFAERLAGAEPDRFTTDYAKSGRKQKILIDYLRNNRTNTSVAAYSTRARPGATISVPLAWDELGKKPPSSFTMVSVPRRLSSLRADPWKAYWSCRQQISPRVMKALRAG